MFDQTITFVIGKATGKFEQIFGKDTQLFVNDLGLEFEGHKSNLQLTIINYQLKTVKIQMEGVKSHPMKDNEQESRKRGLGESCLNISVRSGVLITTPFALSVLAWGSGLRRQEKNPRKYDKFGPIFTNSELRRFVAFDMVKLAALTITSIDKFITDIPNVDERLFLPALALYFGEGCVKLWMLYKRATEYDDKQDKL